LGEWSSLTLANRTQTKPYKRTTKAQNLNKWNTDAAKIAGAGLVLLVHPVSSALDGDSSFGRQEKLALAQSSTNFTIATFDPSGTVKHRFPNEGSPIQF